jgi:hypothetical protein
MGGRARKSEWIAERKWIGEMASAGATWWAEWIPPRSLDEMRSAIQHGPLRIYSGRITDIVAAGNAGA